MSKLAVLILAAGNASRMGSLKQLLRWKETTLLQHAISNAEQLHCDNTIVVLGAHHEEIEKTIETENIAVVVNDHWEKGLGRSIACGIDYIKQSLPDVSSALIMLADQPLIDVNFLNKLIEVYNQTGEKIAYTLYESRLFGVPVIFNRNYFDKLSQLTHDKGAKSMLEKYADAVSSLNGGDFIVDIDTIEDYKRLYKKHH